MRNKSAQSEWRQFRLLWRDSVRRTVGTAVLSRDSDPVGFALWTTAAIAVPPVMYAFNRMLHYTSMGARWIPEYELVVSADRTFFVLYGMLASAMLGALLWEVLLPDATDQEVIGPLPVRARTMVAARLTGALIVDLILASAIAVPSGILFAVVSTTHPAFGFLPAVILGHVLATVGGSLFIFSVLILARASITLVLGITVSERVALFLQLITVALIVGSLFFLPSVLSWLVATMIAGGVTSTVMPPVWFVGLYSWTVGAANAAFAEQSVRAVTALVGVAGLIIPVCVLPSGLFARRSRESRGAHTSATLTRAVTAIAQIVTAGRKGSAIVSFTILSLARSQGHLLLVIGYAGAGLAIGAGRLVTSGFLGPLERQSADATVLMLPLVLMLFLIAGLRTAFAIPTDLDANWIFRLSPPSERTTRSSALAVVFVIGVSIPIVVFGAIATVLNWPFSKTIVTCAFDLTLGLVLAQVALGHWLHVPFACEYVPEPGTVRSTWLRFVAFVAVLGFLGAQVQELALRSVQGIAIYFSVVTASALVSVWRYRARNRPLRFEAEDGTTPVETLGLSEASA